VKSTGPDCILAGVSRDAIRIASPAPIVILDSFLFWGYPGQATADLLEAGNCLHGRNGGCLFLQGQHSCGRFEHALYEAGPKEMIAYV